MAEAAREIGSAAQLAAALQSGESNARVQLYRALDGMLTRAETEGRAVNPQLAEVLHARYRGLARDPERDMVAALLLRAPGDESLEVARQEFFATGNETLVTLLDAWDRLSPQLRAWVLPACIAAERNDRCKDRAAERVCKILLGSVAAADTVTIPELLIAIDSVWRLAPLSKTLDEGLLLPCYRHPDPRVRTAAVAAGSESLDWSEMLVNEADAKVRAALAERMGRCGGACVAKGLAMLLRDASWRIRARAAAALAGMGSDGLGVLERAMAGEDEGARVAAAHGLLRMGSIGAIDEKISPVWYGALKTSGRLL